MEGRLVRALSIASCLRFRMLPRMNRREGVPRCRPTAILPARTHQPIHGSLSRSTNKSSWSKHIHVAMASRRMQTIHAL